MLFPLFQGENIMKVTAIDHVTINCIDTEASFKFYEGVLGLKKLETVDMGDHVLYYYQLPGVKLELIGYKEPQKKIAAGNTDIGIYRHMALTVDNLDDLYQHLIKEGSKINLEPKYIDQIKKKIMLIVDPNGVEIEIIQA
jgi:lactoylglutathione lyase